MEGRANREAGLPGEPFAFEVTPDADCPESDIAWSGDGTPSTGTGRRFRTVFQAGGDHTVTATCGDDTVSLQATVCPIDQWLSRAEAFFGPSIDFTKVKVKESPLVIGTPGTGWTCNDVVRFKRAVLVDDLPREPTLVHELTHVWQHQSGQAQLLKGFVEQVGRRLGRDPYDYGGPAGVRAATSLTGFRKEAQARIVEEYWKSQNGYHADRKGVPFSTAGYVDDLRRLVGGAGIGTRPAARRTFAGTVDAVIARVVNAVADLLG